MKLKSVFLMTAGIFQVTSANAQEATTTSTQVVNRTVTVSGVIETATPSNPNYDDGVFLGSGAFQDSTTSTSLSTSLNTSGSAKTSVGNTIADTGVYGAEVNLNGGSGSNEVIIGSGTITTAGTLTQTGTTSVTGVTTINTATNNTSATTIGVNGNVTSILSSSVNVGTGSGTNTIITTGNGELRTTVSAYAGNTSTNMMNDAIRTSITDTGASAGTVIANNGAERWVADENGKLEVVTNADIASGTTAAMVVTNSEENTHGLVVQEDKTVMSGGVNSTSLSLADNGATFSNSETGRPVQVHGVADGTADFDATNVRQLYSGLAAVLAATPDLRLAPGKTGAGIGIGSYGGFHAVGLGFGHMYENGAVLTVSAGKAAHSKVAYKAGLSWSW